MPATEARSQGPVLPLDVVDDTTTRPGQKRRYHETNAFTGPGRREAQHMLRSIVPQVVTLETPEYDTVGPGKAGGTNLRTCGPASRTVGRRGLGFACPPHRHGNGNRDRDESARRRDVSALNEDLRRIGVIGVPPPEERRWKIDRYSRYQLEAEVDNRASKPPIAWPPTS